MNRIAIIGPCGSGKTTLGSRVAKQIGGVAIDLDELHWEPGWQTAPQEVFVARLEVAITAPRWVISGNYSSVQEKYLAAADTVVWLDYPFPVVFWRLLCRTLRRNAFGEPCCNGNYESWRRTLSRDSIFLWLFKSFKRRRIQSRRILTTPHLTTRLHFTHPGQADLWLKNLQADFEN